MRRRNYKKRTTFTILLIVIAVLVVGYATLSSVLNLFGGLTVVGGNSFNVGWSNIIVNEDSTGIATTPPTITNNDNGSSKQINFVVNLNTPGDFYEFNVDAVNTGTIDAMIGSYDYEILDVNGDPVDVEYLNCTVSYADDTQLSSSQLLSAGETVTYKVRAEFSTDISASELPSGETAFRFEFVVTYVQADDTAVEPSHENRFATDSWQTIAQNVGNGNSDIYSVGDTREIDMGVYGVHTLRVANNSIPEECSGSIFSQTACGFVVEFADIVTTHDMNTNLRQQSAYGNRGGWRLSLMRTFVNNDIYDALPSDLKNYIINTTVISGCGRDEGSNNSASDKLYLLATQEVWGSNALLDTATTNTRQLDYYRELGVTDSNYVGATKSNGSSNVIWWLRSAVSNSDDMYFTVQFNGNRDCNVSDSYFGVSPAFRLG